VFWNREGNVALWLYAVKVRVVPGMCSRLVGVGEASVAMAFPKDAVNPSMGAWRCHPWQRTLLGKPSPHPLL